MKRLTLIDKAFLLKKTPLFVSLDLDLLLPIADKLGIVSFHAGDFIFSNLEEAHRMYFILNGKVEIQVPPATLALLSQDDFFGDESIFNEKPRAYTAISKTDSTLLTLSRTNLLSIISECPSVAVGLLQVYASTIAFRLRKLPENRQ
jgi:CRP/FNR family transcriptional regulator, cyclic AMP receptor protein